MRPRTEIWASFWFLKDVKRDGPNCLEGFLFPDTYDFYTSDDPGRCCGSSFRT